MNQPQYNLFHLKIEEEIIPISKKHRIGQVVFSPLAEGVLTEKYKSGAQPPAGSRATTTNQSIYRHLTEENLLKVEQLTKIASELGISTAQLAIAWILICSGLLAPTRAL